MDSRAIIASLPVVGTDRSVLIDAANAEFEIIIERIEPNNEALTRALWDAGRYIDNHLFTAEMLPVSRDEAVYYIGAFLVHHVVGLAVEADNIAAEKNGVQVS